MRMLTAAAIALAAGVVLPVQAGTLGTGNLVAPLAPGAQSRLSIFLPTVAPDEPVWAVYDLVALSPDDGDGARIGVEGSIEGVMTPAGDMLVGFRARDMESAVSAGTVPERLAEVAGERSREELRGLMGSQMFAAFEAFNSGAGRLLAGRIVRHLPPPGATEATMLVSVEAAEGMQPLALHVTVGQGELPPSLRPPAGGQWLHTAGRVAGGLLFLWLLYRVFRVRRRP